MTTAVRVIVFIVCFLLITALYGVSKELFPPSPGSYLLRVILWPILLYGAWRLVKKIDFRKKDLALDPQKADD